MTDRGSPWQTYRRSMASTWLFDNEYLRSGLEACIKDLPSANLREICKAYGADASGTQDALQKECISLLNDMVSRRDFRFDNFSRDVHHYAYGQQLQSPHRRTGLQQFSGITAHDSSRFHAGNSYVEHQNNYYVPTTPIPHAPNSELSTRDPAISALLAALEFPQMNFRRMNIEKEFPGTCMWLESTEEYKAWKDDRCCTLWIKGPPGAGKSTMMRYAYNEEKASSSHVTIAFFFKAKGCNLEKSVEGMFRALLCQLISVPSCDRSLPYMITGSDQEYYKKHGWPLAILKDLFRRAADAQAFRDGRPVVLYIDALDECAEDEVRELLTYFEDLAEEMVLSESPRVCFSSRPYPNMTINQCETILLDRRPEHNNDIRKYTLHRLRDRIPDEPESNHHRGLISEIIERSSGVFLWVVLVTARLRKSADQGVHPQMLREHLLDIPPALHDLFDTMIDQDETSDCLLQIVQWVLFAQGRLRAIDLYFAVTFSTTSTPSRWQAAARTDWKRFDDRRLHNFILTNSRGFLRATDTESTSYMPYEFIHDSVRKYFLDVGLRRLDPFFDTDVVTESHARLARTCQRYVDNLDGEYHTPRPWELPNDAIDDSDALNATPLLAYIRDKGAFLHAEIADRNGIPQTEFCVNFDFDAYLALLEYPRHEPGGSLSFQSERVRTMQDHAATSLHILVDSQMESLVQRMLQIHANDDERTLEHYINALCGGLGTALHIAVERNNTAIIRALVTSGAHIDFHCQRLGTPLDYAMLLERTESVKVLLELGATTRSELSPHQRRKLLNVRGGREPDPDTRRSKSPCGRKITNISH